MPYKLGLKATYRTVNTLDYTEKVHAQAMPDPHWSLYTIGVDPDYQSRGYGSKIIQPILQMADSEGIPCYLDTSSERSLQFFRKWGFEVVRDVTAPAYGPRYWVLVRKPQPK